MKKLLLMACMAILFGMLITGVAAEKTEAKATKLRHVVCFKYKETATEAQIKEIETAFKALKKSIPGIKTFEKGTNMSPENLNKGFTHCYILTFTSDKDRDAYLVHPEHKAFGTKLGPYLADVFVIDFWVKK